MSAADCCYTNHRPYSRNYSDAMEDRNQMDHWIQVVQERGSVCEGTFGKIEGYNDPACVFLFNNTVISRLLYRLQARPIEAALTRLYTMLTDGTIASQEPDGREIIASMKRATIKDGLVEWSETCYCNPPLRHERATVYDKFFTDVSIKTEESVVQSENSFWTYLKTGVPPTTVAEESVWSGSITRTLGRNTV